MSQSNKNIFSIVEHCFIKAPVQGHKITVINNNAAIPLTCDSIHLTNKSSLSKVTCKNKCNLTHPGLMMLDGETELCKVMAWCHQASNHYMDQCWIMFSEVLWHLPKGNITQNAQDIYLWYVSEYYSCKMKSISPWSQWVYLYSDKEPFDDTNKSLEKPFITVSHAACNFIICIF